MRVGDRVQLPDGREGEIKSMRRSHTAEQGKQMPGEGRWIAAVEIKDRPGDRRAYLVSKFLDQLRPAKEPRGRSGERGEL